jgi:16S rRNA (cytosine1402-N4)-methyltransferase
MMEVLHRAVLLAECLELLIPPRREALMVDGTLGEGGHSLAFLERYPGLSLIGVDADPVILERARERLAPHAARISLERGLAEETLSRLEAEGRRADIVLMDLGISIFHYEASGRGFSFLRDEPLDMRVDPSRGSAASELLARLSEAELAEAFFRLGEERYARRIARAVVERRRLAPIGTSRDFADLVTAAVPPQARHGRLHPATRCFQALRILANDELGRLERTLPLAARVLAPGGRLGIIAFHSLEDRTVKNFFKSLSAPIGGNGRAAGYEILTRKPVQAGDDEVAANPPSRSAKLRVLRRQER